MTDDSTPIKEISREEMRDLFETHQVLQKIATNELTTVLLRERHSDPIKSGQVFCTYSQILSIQDNKSDQIAIAHQYKKPDRTIGASKKPDPVWMYIGGIIYKVKK
jgi:hypothetical protein